MDLIRFELLFRSELFSLSFKKGIYPVLGSQKIIYKKSLKRWETFTIHLHLEGWDDKWVYHKQTFICNDEVYAIAFTKAAFWKNKKTVSLGDILEKSSKTNEVLTPSEDVLRMFRDDSSALKY